MSKKINFDSEPILAPRETTKIIGHERAELNLANALKTGRIAHALLISGPKGIGKATLMYRFARYVLSAGTSCTNTIPGEPNDRPLEVPLKDEIFARIASGTHADLFVLEKGVNPRTGLSRGEITVEEARKLGRFLSLTPAESPWRIAVIDAADEMNRHAANAILKLLEEPPNRTILILISHAPDRLLPTIRSRCRRFNLRTLSKHNFEMIVKDVHPTLKESEIVMLGQLSNYSPGQAFVIKELDGIQLYARLVKILMAAPTIDFETVHILADELSGRGSEPRFKLAIELLLGWFSSFITSAAQEISVPELIEGEQAVRDRFIAARGLDHWAGLWENISHLSLRAEQIHLDRKQVILSAYTAIGDLAKI